VELRSTHAAQPRHSVALRTAVEMKTAVRQNNLRAKIKHIFIEKSLAVLESAPTARSFHLPAPPRGFSSSHLTMMALPALRAGVARAGEHSAGAPRYKALYAYDATDSTQISFVVNTILTVSDQSGTVIIF
jgi:hypothetical protein